MSVQRDIVVTILKETASLSRPGFGVPLIAGYHTMWANRVKEYGGIDELVTDGLATTHPIYKAAQRLFQQSPRVKKFKVGRTLAPTKIMTDTPTAANSTTYTLTINGTPFTFASDASATLAEICTGLAAAVNAAAWAALTPYTAGTHVVNDTGKVYICITAGTSAASGGPTGTGTGIIDGTAVWNYVGVEVAVTASSDATKVTLTADVAGAEFSIAVSDSANLGLQKIKDTTADRGIVADLTAIRAEDDAWYGLLVADMHGKTEILLLAAAIEALPKALCYTSADTEVVDPAITTDVFSSLKTLAYDRSLGIYHPATEYHPDAAAMSRHFATDPGSSALSHKTLVGVATVALSSGQMTAIEGKNGNHYTEAGGIGVLRYGKCASGEWFDIVRGTDAFQSDVEFDEFAVLASQEKVSFTQQGAEMLGTTLEAVFARYVRAGLFAADPEPTVTVPDVLDPTEVTEQNRLDRLLPGIVGQARYAGAIHRATITVRLGV